MRLFHVSEESDIEKFEPRIPDRKELDQTRGLVWAIDEKRLPNFLTPRDCPRVCFYVGDETSGHDKAKYLNTTNHVVMIENDWFEKLMNTTLYLYEFDPDQFVLQDENAGYYVSEVAQVPIGKREVKDVVFELLSRGAELRVVDNLWEIHDSIQETSFHWSICRFRFAQPRE